MSKNAIWTILFCQSTTQCHHLCEIKSFDLVCILNLDYLKRLLKNGSKITLILSEFMICIFTWHVQSIYCWHYGSPLFNKRPFLCQELKTFLDQINYHLTWKLWTYVFCSWVFPTREFWIWFTFTLKSGIPFGLFMIIGCNLVFGIFFP